LDTISSIGSDEPPLILETISTVNLAILLFVMFLYRLKEQNLQQKKDCLPGKWNWVRKRCDKLQ
jgi:hypothetical protein